MRMPTFAQAAVLAAALCALAPYGASAVTFGMTVTATVLSKNQCKMAAASLSITHDAIDPSSTSPATKSAPFDFVCHGSDPVASFTVSAGPGLHSSGGSNRLFSSGTGEYLPYTISFSPASGSVPKNATQTVTVTSTIPVASFQDALAGTYTDSVVITVDP